MDRIKFVVVLMAAFLLTQAQADMNITQPVLLSGAAGGSGQVFTSQGTGFVPIWTTPALTPTTPGGSDTQAQYNNGGALGGMVTTTYDDSINALTTKGGTSFFIVDPTTISKRMVFNVSNVTAGQTRTLNIPDVDSTGAQAKSSVASQWLNSMSAQGVFTSSQPTKTDVGLSNVTNDAQIKSSDWPAVSADGELILFNGTTGKLVKRSSGITAGIATVTASGVLGSTTNNSTNWDTAYTDRLKWDGGATGLTAATGRASLAIADPGAAGGMLRSNGTLWARVVYASYQNTTSLTPTAITGTTAKMFGMGSTFQMTPTASGKVLVTMTNSATWTSGGAYQSTSQIRYNTVAGGVPANNAGVIGHPTAGAPMQTLNGPTTVNTPTLTAVITGLTVNTAYWFDIGTSANNAAGVSNVAGVNCSIVELP